MSLLFTFGLSLSLDKLEPIRVLQILQWPVNIIRLITDPVVDLVSNVLLHIVSSILSAVVHTQPLPLNDSKITDANVGCEVV